MGNKGFKTLWVLLIFINTVNAQSPERFTGFYLGIEGGAISYNTQITSDEIDDPAGRGGFGYGLFLGYNYRLKKLLISPELFFNLASDPNPYTFDPAVIGFSELDVFRNASYGLDLRLGYLIANRILPHGTLGYSANSQSIYIDGIPLEDFGGTTTESFGAFQYGLGLEASVHPRLSLRFSFTALNGYDLEINDFGSIPGNASLTQLDVEPSHHQIFVGVMLIL